jgi:hypothetical protein
VFSFALAGAGISGGQVFGSSDKNGAYAKEDRIEPGDLTATLFHLLGINPEGTFLDREGRIHHFTRGRPLYKLLGTEPATLQRIESTGDIRRVPPFDESQWLVAPDFRAPVPLKPASEPSRPRGWRAKPLVGGEEDGLGVCLRGEQMALGFRTSKDKGLTIRQGEQAILAQEVRSPFAGKFTVSIQIRGDADSREFYDKIFRANFTCKILFFQYTAFPKTPLQAKELASLVLEPRFAEENTFQSFELSKTFVNPKPGANFSFGLGLGVAVVLEKTSAGELTIPPGHRAGVLLDEVRVEFDGKPRNDKVVT